MVFTLAPVALRLRMHLRVAMRFRRWKPGRCGRQCALRAEHVDGTQDRGLDGLDGVVLIMRRRSGAGEVVDLIDFDTQRLGHIMADELKARMIEQVGDVLLATREEIVRADDLMALSEQTFPKGESQKTSATGDKDSVSHRGLG